MKILDPKDPPKNWCFVIDPDDSNKMCLVKWSSSHYEWVGVDLIPIFGFGDPKAEPSIWTGRKAVSQYRETEIKSLSSYENNPR